ncbi:hypothetical protein [Novosphingobium sp. KN65.2]|uniref:hypothetical protein n=1 Tax=Novosphingobium sp. KN65.2 TaxID=1478134 RepID=UPI0005E159F9|nr:hypothetical protein [Novosphingobium sp. KN65.2]CDO36366.1 conserved hypothetical protein [Novosphingobium sp. KN65.2]
MSPPDSPVENSNPGATLVFAEGARPTACALASLFDSPAMLGIGSVVANRSHLTGNGIEALAGGLAFDLRFADGPAPDGQVIRIEPGEHVAAGVTLLPVVRALAGLVANLALHLPVAAIAWDMAGTVAQPQEFSRAALNWLAGGPFPAQCLTSLTVKSDGSIASEGLVHFTGQEMYLVGAEGEVEATAIRLAVGVVDQLVRQGRLLAPREFTIAGTGLLAEPSQYEDRVWVWRKR